MLPIKFCIRCFLLPLCILPIAALVALPAFAQDSAWLPRTEDQGPWDAQLFWGKASFQAFEINPPKGYLKVDVPTQSFWGGRLGLDLLRWGPGVLQASGGLAYGSKSPLGYSNSAGASGLVGADLHLRHQWMGGLTYFHDLGGLQAGLGLDFRRDALMVQASPGLRSYGWLDRFWWRAVGKYRLEPMGSVRPYVALEFAAPLSTYHPEGTAYLADLDNLGLPSNTSQGAAAKTHAPRFQVALAMGLRFGARATKPRVITTTATAMDCQPLAPVAEKALPVVTNVVPTVIIPAVPKTLTALGLPKVIVLDEAALHFALNRWELAEEGQGLLGGWAKKLLAVSPQPRLKITGHTDRSGTRAHNLSLSLRRAQAVAQVLRGHGLLIAESDVAGTGSNVPLVSNTSYENRARNRRVEIAIESAQGMAVQGKVESALRLQIERKPRPTKIPSNQGGK